jgi:hypothetical protein
VVYPDGIRGIKPVIYFTVKGESKITVDSAHSMALALVYTLILKLTTITVSWYVLCSHQNIYLPFLTYDGRHSILYGSGLWRKLFVYSNRLHTSTPPIRREADSGAGSGSGGHISFLFLFLLFFLFWSFFEISFVSGDEG